MAWTGQSFSVGQILTAAQMTNLQSDITAVMDKAPGAPVLANNYVVTGMYAVGSVNTTALSDNSVTSSKISPESVIESKIGVSAVTQTKIASSSVGTSEIINSNVTEEKLETAVSARLVTNGDSHNHSGGDGDSIPFSSITGAGALASLNSVSQLTIDTGSVGQGELNTSISAITISANSSTILAGGLFGFYPQTASNVSGYGVDLGLLNGDITSTTYATYVGNLANGTGKAQQTYINASPPFNLGYGDIPLFVFALIDNATKEIKGTYVANVPPWGYNGKTSLAPDYIDKNGDKFKFKRSVKTVTFEDVINRKSTILEYKKYRVSETDKSILVPINHAMKNADMDDIPHPFGGDLTGKTVVVLDPLCKNTKFMNDLYLDNSSECLDEITKILHSNHIKINVDAVDAGFSNQILCFGSKLK